LTGHLVFSTLHTNDAAGAFTRLMDMGVEPYLLASAVEAIVAQRLVRKLCPACRAPAETDAASLKLIGFPDERPADAMICQAGRCEKCRMTGYRGRGGIFEVLDVTEAIESLVIQRASSSVIKQKAFAEGMRTLRDDGWDKVMQGFTTIDEVLRVSEENE
jgi:general secretion pathway protein E/type IV pilus assembly protein PilB